MSDDWGSTSGESGGPTDADMRARGYEWSGAGDGGQWVPTPPAPDSTPPSPAPTPWNTGQALSLGANNAKYKYDYHTTYKSGYTLYQGISMDYNGTPVVYVPADFVNRGLYDNRVQYYNKAYLNKDIYNYLKPATLDPAALGGAKNTLDGLKKFDNPYTGYIIDEAKFKQLGGNASTYQVPTYSWNVSGSSKDNAPIQGITEKDGQLIYAGLRGSPSASGEYSTYGANGALASQGWKKSSGFLAKIGQSIADLGPATLLLNFAVPGLGTAVYAGTKLGQGLATGNIGQVVTAAAALMLPGAEGAGPIIDVPGVSNIVGTISSATGFSAATSGAILQSGLDYAATGGDIGTFLKGQLASALGAQAGGFVDKLVGSSGFSGLNTIAKNVAASTTKALLLNQDVSKAATNAFADTAVPLALKNTPGWDKLSKTQQTSLTNEAISAAKGGKVDIGTVIKNYTTDVFSDDALKAIPGSDKWTAAQTKLAKDTIAAGVQGKSLDGPLQSYMINQAKTAVNDQVAKAEGWESDAQKQGAKGQYGSAIKPDDYTARQQGWEDLAAKQAAIKSYGDTITPVGVKERDQVKSVDPKFDAEAYLKLNEVTGDPFQHFLTQGNKAKLPTNYESGADAALKSLGYKASADEVKQVADLFKKSANPDVALNKFYDERWVSPAEAAATAKAAGFELTPEQLKTFVGQASSGQNTVLEDVDRAARVGKESQEIRNDALNAAVATVKKTYEDQGYPASDIAAALPKLREDLATSFGQRVDQLAYRANQVKDVYGDKSPEYAAAQKQLLDEQVRLGGFGVVKSGNDYINVKGELRPADKPNTIDTWFADKTKAPLVGTPGSGDFLQITTGAGAPATNATEAIKTYTAGIGIPGETTAAPGTTVGTAIVGELPSGEGTGKVPTLFGIPLSVSVADIGGDAWQRLDDRTWVTPDNKYTFIATPGGGEVRDTASKNIVVTLPPAEVAKVVPPAPTTPTTPPIPVTPTTPTTPPTPVTPTTPSTTNPIEKALAEAQKAADEGRTSQAEAEKLLTAAGYKYTPDELSQFVGPYTPEASRAAVEAYVGPRLVTPDEVVKIYRDLGLQSPTEADIARFVGQRPQDQLTGDLTKYLPTASANVTTGQMTALKAAQDAAAAQAATNQQATQTQFGDVNARIVELMRQGADYQTATTQAQTELKQGQAQLGTKVGELGTKVGDLGTTLGGQLAGLGTQLTAAKQQATQAQQQANMSTLFGLLGGFGGQQAPAPAPQPTPLANIGYVYDIGGKSIFANPQQEKAFVSPYAEGGTVEDLMKILRG